MQNVIMFFRMKTPKRKSLTFLRKSEELGFYVQCKLGNSQAVSLTGFESALFTNGAPIILSRSCSLEVWTPPGHQALCAASLFLELRKTSQTLNFFSL